MIKEYLLEIRKKHHSLIKIGDHPASFHNSVFIDS